MIRLLQLLILIALAVLVWRLVRNVLAARRGPGGGDASAGRSPEFEPTARCVRCGTYVPRAQLDAAGVCPRCLPPRQANDA
jgi:hypothetical protein